MGKRVPGRKIEQCFSQGHSTNKCPLMAVVNYTRYGPQLTAPVDEILEAFNEVELGDGTTCSAPVASSSSPPPSSLFTDDCLLTVGAVVVLLIAIVALTQPWVMQAHSMVLAPRSAPALRWVVATTAMMPVVAQSPCPTCAPFAAVFSAAAFGALVGVLVGVLVLRQRFGVLSSPTAPSPAPNEDGRGGRRRPDTSAPPPATPHHNRHSLQHLTAASPRNAVSVDHPNSAPKPPGQGQIPTGSTFAAWNVETLLGGPHPHGLPNLHLLPNLTAASLPPWFVMRLPS